MIKMQKTASKTYSQQIVFVDFKQAFNSISNIEISTDLIRFTKLTVDNSRAYLITTEGHGRNTNKNRRIRVR